MALIKCSDCGQQISAAAPTCPHCGKPNKSDGGTAATGCIGIILIAVLFAVGAHFCSDDHATPSPSASKPEEKKEPTLNGTLRMRGFEFLLKNDDQFDWKNCEFSVNYEVFGSSGYEIEIAQVSAQEMRTIEATDLSNGDGARFNPITHKAKSVFLRCDTPAGKAYTGWKLTNN